MSRFTPAVEAALRAAGWTPGRSIGADVLRAIEEEIARHPTEFGGRLRSTPAARAVLDEFGGLDLGGEESGVELSPRPFAFDPSLAVQHVETIVDVSRATGLDLYPLGIEGLDDAVLVVDSRGRVLAIDATGEYLLGEGIEAALDTLITGRRPVLLDDHGNWPGQPKDEPGPEPDDVGVLATFSRPSCAAFFLPRTPSNLYHFWLPNTLRRIGAEPAADPIDPTRLRVEWGGTQCQARVLDLDSYTVLFLVFSQDDVRGQIAEDLERSYSQAPLALAFQRACEFLESDLTVAFVDTLTRRRLEQWVTEREFDVLTADTWSLREHGFSLLFLNAAYAADIPFPQADYDEMPMAGGRIMFAGQGRRRWS